MKTTKQIIPGGMNHRKRNHKRNIIWFNPPYSKSVTTNVGKYFLKLLDKHFPKNHKLQKIFNKNTVKMSYSCLPSVKARVNQHDKKVLQKVSEETSNEEAVRMCSCPRNAECPLDNIYLRSTFYTRQIYPVI